MEWTQRGWGQRWGCLAEWALCPTPCGSCQQVGLSLHAQLSSLLCSPLCDHVCSGVFLASWWPGFLELAPHSLAAAISACPCEFCATCPLL